MDLRLSPDQQAIVDAARAAAQQIAPEAAALDRLEQPLAAVLAKAEAIVPEPTTPLELVLATEQLATASAAVATAYWLNRLVRGLPGGDGVDVSELGLRGIDRLLGGAGRNGSVIIAAPQRKAPLAAIVAGASGLELERDNREDGRPSGWRELSGLRALGIAQALRQETEQAPAVPVIVQQARLAHSAVCLGVAQRALDEACQHLVGRVKMPENQPLATFQGLRFMVADVDAAVESARWPLYQAAWTLGETGAIDEPQLSGAVWLATAAVQSATNVALQLAGGSGFSPARPFERLARDAWALVALVG